MNRFITGALLFLSLVSCKPERDDINTLKTGIWRAALQMQGQELPFTLEISRDDKGGYDARIVNGEERILLDEVRVSGDSVDIGLHIFDANIKAKISGDSLQGIFVKNFADSYMLPFDAAYGQEFRFEKTSADKPADFAGKYEVTFQRGTDSRTAVAIFDQTGYHVTGTFLTPTGDYRYLSGIADGLTLKLSAFDGDNLYLFIATMQEDGALRGDFYSGKTRRETWVAKKNENASLEDNEKQTYLKEGYDRISFSFPDVTGQMVSLDDERYKGKVVILQLLGTWCPNCMDETKFLVPWYKENRDRGVEIIGLAYETKDDFAYASRRVRIMMEKLGVDYNVVIAGTTDKEKRRKSLPMLNDIIAFPTTIYIARDGTVRKIHTGFSGPGTGEYFEQFKKEFNATVDELVREDLTAAM